MTIDTLINLFLHKMFPGYEVAGSGSFRVIRDSEIEIDDEAADLVVEFEVGAAAAPARPGDPPRDRKEDAARLAPADLRAARRHPGDTFEVEGFLGLADASKICDIDRPDLKFPPYMPRFPERVRDFNGDLFAAIKPKDFWSTTPSRVLTWWRSS